MVSDFVCKLPLFTEAQQPCSQIVSHSLRVMLLIYFVPPRVRQPLFHMLFENYFICCVVAVSDVRFVFPGAFAAAMHVSMFACLLFMLPGSKRTLQPSMSCGFWSDLFCLCEAWSLLAYTGSHSILVAFEM